MSVLVIAEHNNNELKSTTLNTISASLKISSDLEVIVYNSKIAGINRPTNCTKYGDDRRSRNRSASSKNKTRIF